MKERLFLRLDGDGSHGPESSAAPETLRAFTVPRALRQHVAHQLLYREDLPEAVVERVVPDGAVRLVFNLGTPPASGAGAGLAALAIGASAAPALVRLSGRMAGLSITLRPGAASELLGVAASELENTAAPLDDLWRGEGTRLLERLHAAPDDAARVALLESALVARLGQRRDASHARAARAAELIVTSQGRLPLPEVARSIGVGERRLQQLFALHVGLSPRSLARVARLHGCLRALRSRPKPAWAALALDAGYYDQAHLANDFKALCGVTPTEYLERVVSGSSKTAA